MLKIWYCPRLRELPDGMHSLNSLEELDFAGCKNLESIPFSVSQGKLQSLASLRKLSISGCRLLTEFIGEMEESCAPLLEDLSVSCDKCDYDECDHVSFNKAVDRILRFGHHSLLRLNLWSGGDKDWDSLPHQLQYLTALSTISICFLSN
ncbi:hypothetical protein ACS0TY_026413 [Phlomoides rotata]